MELEEDTDAHYASILASNMNVPGLAKIPFYPDMKVFEKISFPPEQKIYALTYIYKAAKMILGNSPLRQPLLNLILDEASALAQNDLEAFNQFSKISGFGKAGNAAAILNHFIKENNLAGFFALKQALPDLLKDDFLTILGGVESYDFVELVTAISSFIALNPDENFTKCFTEGAVDGLAFTCLLSAGLPHGKLAEILNSVVKSNLSFYYLFAGLIRICAKLDSRLPNYASFPEQVSQIVDGLHGDHMKALNQYKRLMKWLYEDFDDYRTAIRENGTLNSITIKKFFPYVALARGRFDEALQHLFAESPAFLEVISKNPEFCKVLAAKKPEWIREKYAYHQVFLLNNTDVLLVFHSQPSMEELYKIAIKMYLPILLELVLSSANEDDFLHLLLAMEEYPILLKESMIKLSEINEKLPCHKFVDALKQFLILFNENWLNHSPIVSLAPYKVELTLEQLALILETYDDTQLEGLTKKPFGIEFNLDAHLFVKALHNEKCRMNPRLPLLFKDQLTKAKLLCHTPVEIEQYFKVNGSEVREERINAIKAQMQMIQERRKTGLIDPVETAVIFMAMRRVQSAFDESVKVGGDECLLLKSFKKEALEERKSLKRCIGETDESEVARTAENLKKLKIRGDVEDSSSALF